MTLKSALSWRPAMPGVVVSASRALRQVVLAIWRSFWACWDNPMTYPLLGLVAVSMFVAGYGEGRGRLGAVKAELRDARAERDELRQTVGSAQINEQAARRAAEDARNELARVRAAAEAERPPAATPRAPVRRAVRQPLVEPKVRPGWSLF